MKTFLALLLIFCFANNIDSFPFFRLRPRAKQILLSRLRNLPKFEFSYNADKLTQVWDNFFPQVPPQQPLPVKQRKPLNEPTQQPPQHLPPNVYFDCNKNEAAAKTLRFVVKENITLIENVENLNFSLPINTLSSQQKFLVLKLRDSVELEQTHWNKNILKQLVNDLSIESIERANFSVQIRLSSLQFEFRVLQKTISFASMADAIPALRLLLQTVLNQKLKFHINYVNHLRIARRIAIITGSKLLYNYEKELEKASVHLLNEYKIAINYSKLLLESFADTSLEIRDYLIKYAVLLFTEKESLGYGTESVPNTLIRNTNTTDEKLWFLPIDLLINRIRNYNRYLIKNIDSQLSLASEASSSVHNIISQKIRQLLDSVRIKTTDVLCYLNIQLELYKYPGDEDNVLRNQDLNHRNELNFQINKIDEFIRLTANIDNYCEYYSNNCKQTFKDL